MNWRSALALISVVSIILLLGFGLTRNPDDVPSPLVGETAPAFRLPQLDGADSVSLAELAGRPVVVNFWASWCLACIQEHAALVRAWHRYRDRGVEMIGIVYQDTPGNARRYIRERGGDWTHLVDPGTRTAIDFGVYGIPETFFIDRRGMITYKHIGPVTDEIMDTWITALLSETPRAPEADSVAPQGEERLP